MGPSPSILILYLLMATAGGIQRVILPQLATKKGSFVVNLMDFGLGYSGPFQITRPVSKLGANITQS